MAPSTPTRRAKGKRKLPSLPEGGHARVPDSAEVLSSQLLCQSPQLLNEFPHLLCQTPHLLCQSPQLLCQSPQLLCQFSQLLYQSHVCYQAQQRCLNHDTT